MHANLPDIANRWEAKYGLGGVAGLNAQLNSLPEYYLPKNQGGLIPAHQAGIYGLEDGGRIGFRRGTSGAPGGGDPGMTSDSSGAGQTHSGGGGNGGYQSVHDTGAVTQTPGRTSTPKDEGPKDGPDPHGGDWEEGWLNEDLKKVNEIINDPNANRRDKEQALVWKDQFQKGIAASEKQRQRASRNIFQKAWDYVTEHPVESVFNVLSFGGVEGAKTALRINNAIKWGDKIWDTDIKTALKNGFTDAANKMKTHNAKIDVYESLPDGHPEKIALQAELEIGKKTPTEVLDKDGKGATQETSIKIEDIEEVNDAKTQLQQKYKEMDEASEAAWLRQQKMEAKKQAYLAAFRQKYLMGPTAMAAVGGRVPGGYNTGGLSNLFRLKNR